MPAIRPSSDVVPSNWPASAPTPSPRSPLTSASARAALHNWLARADIYEGHKEGLSTSERGELVKLRRERRVLRIEKEMLGKAGCSSSPRTAIGQLSFELIEAEKANYPVTVLCRVPGAGGGN